VQPAAYQFIYRFMANHSAEHPAGQLTYDVVQSWFGVKGSNKNYNAVQGTERIPDDWVSCDGSLEIELAILTLRTVPPRDRVPVRYRILPCGRNQRCCYLP
jgi:hypothetical protein